MKPTFLYNDDPWMLGEDIPNADLFFSNIWLKGFVSYFGKYTGLAYQKILCQYEGYHLWFYFGEKDSYYVAEHLADRIVSEDGYAQTVNDNIILESDKLRAFSETIPQTDLNQLKDETLWQIYDDHNRIHGEYYAWGWIPVAVDMFHNNLTKRVKDYLRTKGVDDDCVNEYLVILTQPTKKSLIFVEQEELLKIAAAIQNNDKLAILVRNETPEKIINKLPKDIVGMLQIHWQKYYYTKHLWVSGEYTLIDYVNQIKDIFQTGEPAEQILAKQYQELEKANAKRLALIRHLQIDETWQRVLDGFGDFMVTKIYRRYAQLLAVHHMSAILKEIARRRFITEKQVRFMRPDEVKVLLLENKLDEKELLERTKQCVYYAEDGFDQVYIGKDAEAILATIKTEIDMNQNELKGETGCVGYAKGKVKIIIRAEDMAKMEPGDILVSIATDPDIVPAMKKAAGIVTEQGGVTSHAAIVSRELGIPCVIGTKIATRVLKDGDMVEVDATRGIVKKLS